MLNLLVDTCSQKGDAMEKTVRCSQCRSEKRLIGQGMCSACYHRERRKKFGRTGGTEAVGRKESFTIPVDFAPMAFLLEKLKKKAGTELREIGCQILWELNKSLGAGA
jgi:hypothetical protein